MHSESRLIFDLTVLVVGGLLGALAARSLRLPPLVGYLLAGIALGPSGFRVIRDSELILAMAQMGVVLLMFAIGLELSLRWVLRARPAAFVAAPVQIALTVGLGYGIGRILGWSLNEQIVLGFALALSSTMVVVKLLSARGELHTAHGEAMVVVLLAQDLAAVLMVAMLPALSDLGEVRPYALLALAGKGAAFIAWVFILGRWVAPAIMRTVARSYSKEIFVLMVAALCFGGAASGYGLGFSLALGAFAAGLVISESHHSHEVLANVVPFRDLFGMVFFVSLGLLVDVRAVLGHVESAVVLVIAILAGKSLLAAIGLLAARYHLRTAVVGGLGLGNIGEFSFLVATLAWQENLISKDLYSLLLAAATVSLLATPALMRLGSLLHAKMRVSETLQRMAARRQPASARAAGESLADHVVLCGHGRVGRLIGETLLEKRHPFIVVELDQHVVADLRSRNVPVLYGDAGSPVLLAAAGAVRARLAVVALPEGLSAKLAIRELRRINPSVPIVARVHTAEEVEAVYREGATQVVYAEFEASLEIMRYALHCLGYAPGQVQALVDETRSSRRRCLAENEEETGLRPWRGADWGGM